MRIQPKLIPPDLVFKNVDFSYKPDLEIKQGRRYPASLGRIAVLLENDEYNYKLFKPGEITSLRTSIVLIDGRYTPLIYQLVEVNFEINLLWNLKFVMKGDEIDYALARLVNADFMFLLLKKLTGQPLYI